MVLVPRRGPTTTPMCLRGTDTLHGGCKSQRGGARFSLMCYAPFAQLRSYVKAWPVEPSPRLADCRSASHAEAGIAKWRDRADGWSIGPDGWSRGFAGFHQCFQACSCLRFSSTNGPKLSIRLPVAPAAAPFPAEKPQVLKLRWPADPPLRWEHAWRLVLREISTSPSVRCTCSAGTPPVCRLAGVKPVDADARRSLTDRTRQAAGTRR